MIRAFKYRLNPTDSQVIQMEKTFGCCRYIYNWALDLKIQIYQREKRSVTAVDLCKQLTILKKDEDHLWLNDVSNECLQQSIRCLDQAFTKFFREHSGFPKFKSKHRSKNAFKNINSVKFDFESNRIKIPIIGWVKFFPNRVFECKNCGTKIDRDLNAALNIQRVGVDILYNRTQSGEITNRDEASKIE